MIRAENISKSFGEHKVLKNVSFDFEPGKTNLIIGQSGSGKTVFVKCLVGLHEVDEGKIFYDDKVFNELDFYSKKALRQEIGMLFQGSALFDSMTVEENVMFPLNMMTNQGLNEKIDRVNFCLEKVNLPGSNQLFPSELSGGMQKRVAIARAIALNPKYLFCDEPNSGLDPKTSVVIDKLIYELTQEFNMTTIINTHDLNSVIEIGDKIAFIYQGELGWQGTKHNVLDAEDPRIREFVYATEILKRIKK
jgi:phospholipid/cholesterol/gamma-HCH transport system ATP-binding protein